jgi:hypothetical protein
MSAPKHRRQRLDTVEVAFPPRPVRLDLIFCEHDAPRSLPQVFGRLAIQSDVIALEAVGWSDKGAKLRQSVAEGDADALKKLSSLLPLTPQGGFWRRLNKGLLNAKAKIHYPDAPENHPIANAYIAAVQEEARTVADYNNNRGMGYDVSPKMLLPMLKKTFATIEARDQYILEHLFPKDITLSESGIHFLGLFGLVHRRLATFIEHQAEIQGRSDIMIQSYESGLIDPTPYERYLEGIDPTVVDVETYYPS